MYNVFQIVAYQHFNLRRTIVRVGCLALLKRTGLTQLWQFFRLAGISKRACHAPRLALRQHRDRWYTHLHNLYSCTTEGRSLQMGIKKGDSMLMGIGMNCFYWVKFYLLQTLFRLGPRGPKKCQSRIHLRRAKSSDERLCLNFTFEGNH